MISPILIETWTEQAASYRDKGERGRMRFCSCLSFKATERKTNCAGNKTGGTWLEGHSRSHELYGSKKQCTECIFRPSKEKLLITQRRKQLSLKYSNHMLDTNVCVFPICMMDNNGKLTIINNNNNKCNIGIDECCFWKSRLMWRVNRTLVSYLKISIYNQHRLCKSNTFRYCWKKYET